MGWVLALPFFFYASPAPLACRGGRGYAPCVRVLPLRFCLLGWKVKSPCCLPLPSGGCASGLRFLRRSWFITTLGSWTNTLAVGWSRYLMFFLYLTLGSSLSLPVLPASLWWLRFLLGCPPSVASLWRGCPGSYQALVDLPSWVVVPLDSWDRSPISGLSVFFLSPRPLCCFPSFGWVSFWS